MVDSPSARLPRCTAITVVDIIQRSYAKISRAPHYVALTSPSPTLASQVMDLATGADSEDEGGGRLCPVEIGGRAQPPRRWRKEGREK